MPISVIEAMAAGLPVVATDIGGNRDLLANTAAGRLVQTPTEMVSALHELIEHPEARRLAGEAARALTAERHSAARMVRDFYGVYGLAG